MRPDLVSSGWVIVKGEPEREMAENLLGAPVALVGSIFISTIVSIS